jgi:type II secretory pathway component PulF
MTEPQGQPTCPRCGAARPPDAAECGRCGIIFARWAPARTERRSPPVSRTATPYVQPLVLQRLLESLARSLSAGLTLPAAGVLDPLPAALAGALRRDLDAGVPLSQALEGHGLLDAGARAVLGAAEARGALPGALQLAAEQLARARKLRNGLLLALAYPSLLLMAAVILVPLPTAFREGVGAYLVRAVPPLLLIAAAAAGAVFGLPRLRPSSPLRRAARWTAARVPLASQAVRSDTLAAFLGVLGGCLEAGLPMRESLTLAARTAASHPAFQDAERVLVGAVDRGATLVDALRLVGCVPALDLAQVGTAERAGTLGRVLPTLETHHRERARMLWIAVAGVVAVLVFLGVAAVIVGEIVHGWVEVFRAQGEQIDRVTR